MGSRHVNARDRQSVEKNIRRNVGKEDDWEHWCHEISERIQPENPREVQLESPELSDGDKPSKIRHGKCPLVNN